MNKMNKQELMKTMGVAAVMIVAAFVFIGCRKPVEKTEDDKAAQQKVHKKEVEEGHEHDYSVEIEGKKMKTLTVRKVADLWKINPETLLAKIIDEFNFKGNYTIDTVLEKMREEYKFSPSIIKDIAEKIKTNNG
ncbi:hypothetical protein KAU39_02895 [bacterium]|nr:hypothetical protein [bacterium]